MLKTIKDKIKSLKVKKINNLYKSHEEILIKRQNTLSLITREFFTEEEEKNLTRKIQLSVIDSDFEILDKTIKTHIEYRKKEIEDVKVKTKQRQAEELQEARLAMNFLMGRKQQALDNSILYHIVPELQYNPNGKFYNTQIQNSTSLKMSAEQMNTIGIQAASNLNGINFNNDEFNIFQKIQRYMSGCFLTLLPQYVDRFVLRNPFLRRLAIVKYEDAFSDFVLHLNKQYSEEEIAEEERELHTKRMQLLVSGLLSVIELGELYGGAAGVVKYQNEDIEDCSAPLEKIEDDQLHISAFNRWEVSFTETKEKIHSSAIKNSTTAELHDAIKNYINSLKDSSSGKDSVRENFENKFKDYKYSKKKHLVIKGTKIHESRIVVFKTDYATSMQTRMIGLNWGISCLDIHQEAISSLLTGLMAVQYFVESRGMNIWSMNHLNEGTMNELKSSLAGMYTDGNIITSNGTSFQRIESTTNPLELQRALMLNFCTKTDFPSFTVFPQDTSLIGGSNGENETERQWKKKVNKVRIKYEHMFSNLLKSINSIYYNDSDIFTIKFEPKSEKTFEQQMSERTALVNNLTALNTLGANIDFKATLLNSYPELVFNEEDLFANDNNNLDPELLKSIDKNEQ